MKERACHAAASRRDPGRIRSALGRAAVLIEHPGSTSVPGLAAKPIIDIALAVPDSADEPSYRPTLETAGYVPRHLQHYADAKASIVEQICERARQHGPASCG